LISAGKTTNRRGGDYVRSTETSDKGELQNAFMAFSRMSVQLEASYRELEQRVHRLTEELAAARSERLHHLAEKEKLADRLEKLLDGLPGGVIVLDQNGVIRDANPAAVDLLGEPLVGERWSDISLRVLLTTGGDANEVQLSDGRWVNIASCALESGAGRILLLNDVTDTRALQDTINRQRRLSAMGEMVAKLAHQIRTPLSSALLYASHLTNARLADTSRSRFAVRLLDRLRHLESMVTDMLVFARGGSTGEETFTVGELIDDLVQLLEAQMGLIGAAWEINDQAHDLVLQGSRQALLGALSNLANNSLEVAGKGARLFLSTQCRGDSDVEIRLADNGPGIPDALRERVFEPFFTTRPEGTGLGLAVVQVTVAAHEGGVRVESHTQGGACFVIQLPSAGHARPLPGGVSAKNVQPVTRRQLSLLTAN
jgi:two-component system sensor histidine kinase FlrB